MTMAFLGESRVERPDFPEGRPGGAARQGQNGRISRFGHDEGKYRFLLNQIRHALLSAASRTGESAAAALAALWTFPAVLFSAFVIAWGAEAAQFFMSQGLALAILAWLQTLPEFAVEADIAWRQDVPNMTANFTGSLRLLVGLGWSMIFAVATVAHRRKTGKWLEAIVLDEEHAVQVVGLFVPILYFIVIWWKASLTVWDGLVLVLLYILYLYVLNKMPPRAEEESEELDYVLASTINGISAGLRNTG